MSGRPWLEALKATMREQGTDTEKPLEKILEALPSEGCERCESPADRPTPIVDLQTTDKRGPWGKEERRLTAAGWKPKERCGKTIYQSPKRGFWYSQKNSPAPIGERERVLVSAYSTRTPPWGVRGPPRYGTAC